MSCLESGHHLSTAFLEEEAGSFETPISLWLPSSPSQVTRKLTKLPKGGGQAHLIYKHLQAKKHCTLVSPLSFLPSQHGILSLSTGHVYVSLGQGNGGGDGDEAIT